MGVALKPCCDPDPKVSMTHSLPTWEKESRVAAQTADTWFESVPASRPEYIGVPEAVLQVLGTHQNRHLETQICLLNIHTGERGDLTADDFVENLEPGGTWRALTNEMEVIAWASR